MDRIPLNQVVVCGDCRKITHEDNIGIDILQYKFEHGKILPDEVGISKDTSDFAADIFIVIVTKGINAADHLQRKSERRISSCKKCQYIAGLPERPAEQSQHIIKENLARICEHCRYKSMIQSKDIHALCDEIFKKYISGSDPRMHMRLSQLKKTLQIRLKSAEPQQKKTQEPIKSYSDDSLFISSFIHLTDDHIPHNKYFFPKTGETKTLYPSDDVSKHPQSIARVRDERLGGKERELEHREETRRPGEGRENPKQKRTDIGTDRSSTPHKMNQTKSDTQEGARSSSAEKSKYSPTSKKLLKGKDRPLGAGNVRGDEKLDKSKTGRSRDKLAEEKLKGEREKGIKEKDERFKDPKQFAKAEKGKDKTPTSADKKVLSATKMPDKGKQKSSAGKGEEDLTAKGKKEREGGKKKKDGKESGSLLMVMDSDEKRSKIKAEKLSIPEKTRKTAKEEKSKHLLISKTTKAENVKAGKEVGKTDKEGKTAKDSEISLDTPARHPLREIIKGERIVYSRHPISDDKKSKPALLFETEYNVFDDDPKVVQELPEKQKDPHQKTSAPCNTKENSEIIRSHTKLYALSDLNYINKGWTLLPTEKVLRRLNLFRMQPSQPEFNWFKRNQDKSPINYTTGEKLAEIDENGCGQWFYKNGKVALDYYNATDVNVYQRYVVYSSGESDTTGRVRPVTILAMFDFQGNGVVFDDIGNIRLKYNQSEGMVLDEKIIPYSHWKWHSLNEPPVFQKVLIDNQLTFKDQNLLNLNIQDVNRSGKPEADMKMLAIEFDNFVKERIKQSNRRFELYPIKMKALKINENFSLKILDQKNIFLRFQDGSTHNKLNVGMVLDNSEIIGTETVDLGDVTNILHKFPAQTESVASMQKCLKNAINHDLLYNARQDRLLPFCPQKVYSSEKLVAALSKPLRTC